MSEKKIRDFAKTPHSEVPKKKVTEAIANPQGVDDKISPKVTQRQSDALDKYVKNKQRQYGGIGEDFDTQTMSSQELNLRRQEANIKDRIAELRKKAVRKQQPTSQQTQNPQQTQNASAKMSLENYVMVKKDGSRVIMPGDPPKAKIERKPPERTPEEEAAFRKAQRKRAAQQAIDMYKPRAGESD
jgi:hypothetical protein